MKERTKNVPEVWVSSDRVILFLAYDPEQGMLRTFAEALVKHARCAYCGGPLKADFSKCGCDNTRNMFRWAEAAGYSPLRVEYDVWRDILEPLWKKDRRRTSSLQNKDRRAQAIKESDDPSYTSVDINCLRIAQGNACYYCGASIHTGAQVDHLDPLFYGGSNGFGNIMLACASCNLAKGVLNERLFWKRLRKQLPEEEFDRRRAAAKAMKKAKWRIHREAERSARRQVFEL